MASLSQSDDQKLNGLGGGFVNPAVLADLQRWAPELDILNNPRLDRLVLVQDRRKCEHPDPFRPIWIEDDRLIGCPAAHFSGMMTPYEFVYLFDIRGHKINPDLDTLKPILERCTRWGGERGRQKRAAAAAAAQKRIDDAAAQDRDFKRWLLRDKGSVLQSFKVKREVVSIDGMKQAG